MGHFWDMDKNNLIYFDLESFPHLPAHNCKKSADCLNICLDDNCKCTKTDKTVYDSCPFYKRKREGEYPQKDDLFLFGNNWKPAKKPSQVSCQEYVDDKLYFIVTEKENIPNSLKNLGIKDHYDDGYFRIIKKLEKVIFVRWVCGR